MASKNSRLKILVLGYLRPDILKQCLDGLHTNKLAKDASVTICIDGLKAGSSADFEARHKQTVAVAQAENRFGENQVIVNPQNLGVTKQYFDKFNLFFKDNDELVIIEDDVVVGEHFLDFVTESFARYGDNPKLALINGYAYYVPFIKKSNTCYFANGGGNQAFGITKTFWDQVDIKCAGYERLKTDAKFRKRFNTSRNDSAELLIGQLEGKYNGAWDAIFWWNIFSKNLLSLYPDRTLSTNIGWNSVGSTHTFIDNPFETKTFDSRYKILNFPDKVELDVKRRKMYDLYFDHFFRFKYYRVKLRMALKRLRNKK